MSVITLQDVCKQYETYQRAGTFGAAVKSLFRREIVLVRAVENVSFSIREGEIVGILGKNGAGKSTLIKMMTGVLYPTSGTVESLGFSPARQRARYVQHIGAVFGQKSQLIWDIPPADAFAMNKAIYGLENAPYQATLNELVEALQVGEVIRRPTRVLSLGERMKCEFIMAMLHQPRLVFLDEPTIGLDAMAKETIRTFVRAKNREGTTFILTTHDLDDIERLARRVMILSGGCLVFDKPLPALRRYLGNQRILRVSAETPLALPEDLGWARVAERLSDREVTLLVDGDAITPQEMLARAAAIDGLKDIAIESLSVEEILKAIYAGQTPEKGAD